jgi:hypothetical protein
MRYVGPPPTRSELSYILWVTGYLKIKLKYHYFLHTHPRHCKANSQSAITWNFIATTYSSVRDEPLHNTHMRYTQTRNRILRKRRRNYTKVNSSDDHPKLVLHQEEMNSFENILFWVRVIYKGTKIMQLSAQIMVRGRRGTWYSTALSRRNAGW